ncbi:NUDIX domain-containing protein [Candidatus Woesearchaeota archaeon]|nr:NUDIX domain-containing protein [Candidatus Woesearchaeota archaeon]
MEQGTAAKAFIINGKNEILLIRRSHDDVHKPGIWEVPGGRLEPEEHIFDGLKREAKEETGLDISINSPLKEHNFTREDGQRIRMLTYMCRLSDSLGSGSASVVLSNEHSDHEWLSLDDAKSRIVEDFNEEIEAIKNAFKC